MPEIILVVFWVFMAFSFGLLIGSFLNVCVYRLPAGITIVRGHSFCPNCKHPLGPADLVPVFSYLLLKRRCRYCSQPISGRYARVELLTGAYFGLAAWLWRPGVGLSQLPDWLIWLMERIVPGLAADSLEIASFTLFASLALAACAMFAFSGFLVWAMIFFDQHLAPRGLFAFTAIPVVLRLLLQPDRLVGHLAAMALGCLFVLLLVIFKLLPDHDRRTAGNLAAGLGLLGLLAGLQAIQPVLALFLVELVILTLHKNRRAADNDGGRALQIWRSLPLQGVLVGCVLLLVF